MRAFVVLCALAALAPLFGMPGKSATQAPAFPGWPTIFEGLPLERLPAAPGDAFFSERLEGRMARFRTGDQELVLRWTWRVGTGLHSGRHCYRGLGFAITPQPARLDEHGRLWSCFSARRGEEHFQIRELIADREGQSWPEVSGWFWDACRGRTTGPWWSSLVVQRSHDARSNPH